MQKETRLVSIDNVKGCLMTVRNQPVFLDCDVAKYMAWKRSASMRLFETIQKSSPKVF